ncbi:O-antigen ligase family protein [Andreprevotia chitinilytica]|uniref:O-antigen ligase family protein n=1 Tax=Andreprevotia chitinilytica TaxID=396808 RepID=UPI001470108C|nr:O-antigen ligase family protein [Andreprevotia chitinilytica]
MIIAAGFLVILLMLNGFSQSMRRLNLYDYIFILFCIWRVASCAWSLYPHLSVLTVKTDVIPSILGYLLVRIGIPLACVPVVTLLKSLILSCLAAMLLRTLYLLWPDYFYFSWLSTQVIDIVMFGTLLAAIAPVLLCGWVFRGMPAFQFGWARKDWIVLFLAHYVASGLLFSRILELAFAVMVIFCGTLLYLYDRPRFYSNRLMLFVGAVFYFVGMVFVIDIRNEYFQYGNILWDTFSKTERWIIYSNWIRFFLDFGHWYGWGLGWGGPAGVVGHLGLLPKGLPTLWFSHGHNVFLNALLQTGYPGVALLLVFIFGSALRFARQITLNVPAATFGLLILGVFVIKNGPDDGARGAVFTCFVMLIALAHSLLDASGRDAVRPVEG